MDGVWLVGWIGGLNRFSWVRFKVTSASGGTAQILAGKLAGGTVPFWNCSGSTSWNITSKPETLQLHFPSSLCVPAGLKSSSYSFTKIKAYSGSYPKGALKQATVTAYQTTPTTISGYRFPASQCNAAMTTCKDPFGP